ncbi:MAG: hypothetical protein RQ758_03680 [Methanomicrobiaceae archaeon]|nr:hypothetical protein [Methanomicrobiaceae archaeon]
MLSAGGNDAGVEPHIHVIRDREERDAIGVREAADGNPDRPLPCHCSAERREPEVAIRSQSGTPRRIPVRSPLHERLYCFTKPETVPRKRILHPGRDLGIVVPLDEVLISKDFEGVGECLWADTRECSLQFGEPNRPGPSDKRDDQECPFLRNIGKYPPEGTVIELSAIDAHSWYPCQKNVHLVL